MFRLRLASLALAAGLLVTMSGCCSFCEDGRFRLFRSNSMSFTGSGGVSSECECHSAHLPPGMSSASLPGTMFPSQVSAGQTVPIPITNMPPSQPPQIFKVPQAAPTPYSPTN
jgi:hypothetical protein